LIGVNVDLALKDISPGEKVKGTVVCRLPSHMKGGNENKELFSTKILYASDV